MTMAEEDLSDDSLAAAFNLIFRAANAIASTSDGLIDRHAFSELSSCLRRTVVILRDLYDNSPSASISPLATALGSLSEAANAAAAAASSSIDLESSRRSRLYLVISSRQTSRRLSSATRDLYHAISLLPLSSSAQDKIEAISDRLAAVEFRASSAVEEILDKLESAVCDRASDRAYANYLLSLVAGAAGVSHDPLTLRVELGKLRAEVAEARESRDLAEAVQMDQIVSFLSISDSVSSFREREERYLSKRNRLGNQPLEPLQPFLCPITGDVMDDPVETSLGHTFEKTAIEKWFAEGNSTCPLTMTPLSVGDLRHNYTLKKSIEEWRERNRIISIANLKTKFESNDEQEVLHCLDRLEEFYKEDTHRDWIVFENYPPLLVGLLERKSLEIRCRALFVLYTLAKDSDDTKEQLGGIDKLIEFVVMSLGRRSEERKLAMALLLELSRIEMICSKIGKVRGCIFLLVTTTNDGNQAATDATQLLENLSYLDENVVKMAKANYFKPLLQCLRSGNDDVKKIMVTTLAEIELPDLSKAALFRNGALDVLLHLVKHSDSDIKTMAVKSLQSLSSLPENGVKMIREGALSPLLDLLRHHHCTSSHILCEQAAATIMNIVSSAVDLKDDESLTLLKSDDDILCLFSLVNLTGPIIQQSILQTLYALCHITSAEDTKYKLRQCHAIEVLIPHCQNNNTSVRLNAIKLLSCLTENIDANLLSDNRCLETLQSIINTSKDDEEIAASMDIISSLPADFIQIIQWLIEGNGLASIIQFLKNAKLGGPSKNNELIENAARVLCHFTIPANSECQKKAVQAGAISHLVHLLEVGTSLSKRYAAISLAQFSENSFKLSEPIAKRRVFFCCAAAAAPEAVCEVHNGVCSVEHSFCLLEAEAVLPLVRLLSEPDLTVNEAALIALSTLIVDERLQSGSKLLFEMNGIVPIIKLLNSQSPDVQVKSAIILERIFRLEEYKKIYGTSAQMSLIYITHKGNSMLRALAAKILAHLNVLHEQSSYF